ncbi:hypothetical protein [Peribacillus butanolivorans]|uniref:Uncharacterized protein n=1 Tax=Peribacillus butanolivorans TaxID=421767 RepID=A0ABM6XRG6_9BACI|nr:hypothetical protein [Peribacillus butanolivorans]AXN41034.1 hypothetical protein DTO10_23425 [Peribacillus butanolivorans]
MVNNTMVEIYDYKLSLIRNFGVKELTKYLKLKITDYNKLLKGASGSNSYQKIRTLLNEQVTNGFDDREIDTTFFEALVHLFPERCYYLNVNTDLTADRAYEEIENSSKFSPYVNRKLSLVVSEDEKLMSIRKEGHRIIFLFKLGKAELGLKKDQCAFYVSCILDFKQNHLEIRLNQYLLRNVSKATSIQLKHVINHVTNFVNNQLPIALSTAKSGEAKIHKGLYKLFLEESNKSLKLIKKEITKNEAKESIKVTEKDLRGNISKYLKEQLHISNPEPFVEKVMTVKYQDTAKNMKHTDFIRDGGYIFGFSFIDRKITRSINRNEDHKPVYYSKIYWSLKDVVKEYEEVSELGIYWKFNRADYTKKLTGKEPEKDQSFVEIGLKEIHGVLEIHYYVDYTQSDPLIISVNERRIREEYVIHKIKEFVQ